MSQILSRGGLLFVGMLLSLGAQAATTWTFDIPPPGSAPCTANSTTSVTCVPSTGSTDVTASAIANTKRASPVSSSTTSNGDTSTYTIESAYVTVYSGGVGVTNQGKSSTAANQSNAVDGGEGTEPEHAIDNNGTNSNSTSAGASTRTSAANKAIYDMVLLVFDEAVKLTGVKIGWPTALNGTTRDSDITLLAYNGTVQAGSSISSTLLGKTYSAIDTADSGGNGWTHVEHISDLASGVFNSTAGDFYSRYWLIGTFNPVINTTSLLSNKSFNGMCKNATTGLTDACDVGNDYLKLLAVQGDVYSPPPGPPGTVPEPGTISLLAAACLGVFGVRRQMIRRTTTR